MKFSEKSIVSDAYDLFFICFPIWIPLMFFFTFRSFTNIAATLFLFALFFLAETHFGATWLFFMDQQNWHYMKSKPLIFFVYPLVVITITLLTFFLISPAAALVLASAASAFHVTRQSIGINKMFGIKGHPGLKLSNFAIYLMSAFFILIGFLRFFANRSFTEEQLVAIQVTSTILVLAFFVLFFSKKENRELSIKFHLTTLTGILIYAPYTFVERPEFAIAMGVGMHWLQYLALTMPLYLRKSESFRKETKVNLISTVGKNKGTLVAYLLLYAGIMLMLRQWGIGFRIFDYSFLIIIPVSFQMLHFYYESFIWRFSEPHIRKEVGAYLFTKTEQTVSTPSSMA